MVKNKIQSYINDISHEPVVTICVLTYGNYDQLAKKCINSIIDNCTRSMYKLVVGANEVGEKTLAYLEDLFHKKNIDELHISAQNINKNPMMRVMFKNLDTKFTWWFDDDSYITNCWAFEERLRIGYSAEENVVMWGHMFFFGNETDFSYGTDVINFVKTADWYQGKEPPCWRPGGKGEYNFEGKGTGDGRWFFITGGSWFIHTDTIKKLNWPDPRLIKRNDDVFLCEAIRQNNWIFQDISSHGVAINTEPRRGEGEDQKTMLKQMNDKEQKEPQLDLSGWFNSEEAQIYQELASSITNGVIVELGVWKGRSISNLLDFCKQKNNKLIAIDKWKPIFDEDEPELHESQHKDILSVFKSNLKILNHTGTVTIIQEDSARAAKLFANKSVDMVFIDACHSYESVKKDILAWQPKLKKGGTLCGHDFTWKDGVRKAVNEMLESQVIFPGGSIWKQEHRINRNIKNAKGCVFIPTFQDTGLLEENYGNRPELQLKELDFIIFDDNHNPEENMKVLELCHKNNWTYKKYNRREHGKWEQEYNDLSGFNYFVWDCMTTLAEDYDYVMKMDTDAYIIDPDFYKEFESLLYNQVAIAGTPEYRPTHDVVSFWNISRGYGFNPEIKNMSMHIQGGIYALSKKALKKLKEMGFLHGKHYGFAEDGYMSYACQLLGVESIYTKHSGSWWRSYRPNLRDIKNLKAIHPLSRSEWEKEYANIYNKNIVYETPMF